jgi:RNA-binding protein 39
MFEPFGDIEFVDIHRDATTKRCKGFAFIQFKKVQSAKDAISRMNNYTINGKPIKVSHVTASMLMSVNNSDSIGLCELDEDSAQNYLHTSQSRV